MKNSLAIAYSMKRKAEKKKMADGGPVLPGAQEAQDSMRKAFKFADGGKVKGVHTSEMEVDAPRKGEYGSPRTQKRWAGESSAGYAAKNIEDGPSNKEKALAKHGKVIAEMQSIKPKLQGLAHGGCPSCGYAEGGFIGSHQPSGKPEVDREFGYEGAEKASGWASHEGNNRRPSGPAMSEDARMLNQHGAQEEGEYEGGQGFHGESYMGNPGNAADNYQSEDHEDDMVGRIMKQKQQMYSKGGQVANDTHQFESSHDPNEFDDLVLRDDDMEDADYTRANSGDELDNPGENERRSDIISKIMASRKKKDKLPRPA